MTARDARMLQRCMLQVIILLPVPALAQTASQITPPTFAPPGATAAGSVVIPSGAGAVAPAGSEAIDVRVGDVAIEGAVPRPDALAALKARLVGRTIKVSEIFAAARELEVSYARAGHVLTRVTVPPQTLADGATLRLVIVDGYIERIDVGNVPANVRHAVEATLAPLAGVPGLTLAALERRLLLAADLPGVVLRSTLAAGTKPGAVVLVIEGTQRPVSGFVTLDNTLPSALGRYAFGVGVDFNSVLGAGELIYLRANGLPNGGSGTAVLDATPRNRALAGGVILPLGHDGLMLNIEGTDARTAPRHDSRQPGFGSRFQRLSARVRYPLVLTRAVTLMGELAFDAQDERVRIIDPVMLPLSLDRLRIVRAGATASVALPGGGIATVHAQGSVGLNALGARDAADATALLPLSRSGVRAAFHKIEADATLEQPIASHAVIALRARAQTAFGEVLGNSEQIGIATLDGLSPLGSGSLQGDAGFIGRAELKAPFALRFRGGFGQIAPYGFGAYGQVRFSEPTTLERSITAASAFGAGLRLYAAARDGHPGLRASIEYGRAQVDGRPGHASRIAFTTAVYF
ncbi:ShlB/FhaC/HecB family hemolysin secretion/activation protein [Sphingomonas hengshuiensis]|uniref:ShlB/FhaC/HecB family hemolysin secretion/activation protein n=1 Tax=Sphingomonas hengshuiensis TaxID=1609977 RepID=UPI000B06C6AD|nr:ShlB/FhaC/HecB family hemolysin secretion/activation protein [Sphingomonas hengshuiensis]